MKITGFLIAVGLYIFFSLVCFALIPYLIWGDDDRFFAGPLWFGLCQWVYLLPMIFYFKNKDFPKTFEVTDPSGKTTKTTQHRFGLSFGLTIGGLLCTLVALLLFIWLSYVISNMFKNGLFVH